MQPAFKRIDLNQETYKARWHVSKATAAVRPFDQPLKFLEKNRLDFIGPSIEDVIQPEEKEQESEMQNTGKLSVDSHVDHRQ